jgi:hypothetical protein
MLSVRSFVLSASLVLATALAPIAAHAGGKAGIAASAPVGKAVTTGSCITNRSDFAASDLDVSSTTSTSHVNIPEASVVFTQHGAVAGCVIVNFSGMGFASGGALLYVRALLDSATVALPLETQFSGDDDENANGEWSRSHDYNFVFPSVLPGTHTIQMQFRSLDGKTVFMNRHTTVVQHR